MKPDQLASFTASVEADDLLDRLAQLPRRDWLTVYHRFEQFSGLQWGRMFTVIADASRERRLHARLSDAAWDSVNAELDRQQERYKAIIAALPKTAAGDTEYRAKMDFAVRRRFAVMRLREFLARTAKGRRVIEVVTGLFDGVMSAGSDKVDVGRTTNTKAVRASSKTRVSARTDGGAVSAAYKALVKTLQRKEARREQAGAYTPTHGEELFEALFLTLDGVVQNGGLRHYLDNPSGDGAERAKTYLAEIGAWRTLAVLDEVSAHFPGGVIPERQRTRVAILTAADKRMKDFNDPLGFAPVRYREAQEQLYARLAAYVKANRREFPWPGKEQR